MLLGNYDIRFLDHSAIRLVLRDNGIFTHAEERLCHFELSCSQEMHGDRPFECVFRLG